MALSEGKNKALIPFGHIPSEQPGVQDCAECLKTFIIEVSVEFVATLEQFWLRSNELVLHTAQSQRANPLVQVGTFHTERTRGA